MKKYLIFTIMLTILFLLFFGIVLENKWMVAPFFISLMACLIYAMWQLAKAFEE